MTSKIITILCIVSLILYSDDNINEYIGLTATLRPTLFRSEFVSNSTLRVLQEYSQQTGYTAFGYPDFGDAVITRNLHLWETKLAQTEYYSRFLNKMFRQYYIDHPEIFSKETIEAAKLGQSWNNPKLTDGTELVWHHGKKGYELRPKFEHQSKPHTGGAKTWGYKYAEASKRIPYREIILTAQRWGKFVALDLALSTFGLALSGAQKPEPYLINLVASTTAGCVAWGVESLIITAYPLTQGSTPLFLGECMINIGGPAVWIASGMFFLSKYAIIAGWNKYQVHLATIIEQQCKRAEKKARFLILKDDIRKNNEKLKSLEEI